MQPSSRGETCPVMAHATMRVVEWWLVCTGHSTLHRGSLAGLAWEAIRKAIPQKVSSTSHLALQRTRTDRNRYHMSRQFVPPGRLMHLRPVKAKCKEKKLERRYHAVWIEAGELQVGPSSSVLLWSIDTWRVAGFESEGARLHQPQHCCP